MAQKSRLSRQYVYAPLADLNFPLDDANVHQVAFMPTFDAEPLESDWVEALVVTQNNENSSLYSQAIGNSLAVLVGPERGDAVDTEDLAAGDYLLWSDVSVPESDERIVVWHGAVEVIEAPGNS